ncbi:hypothetical protein GCM10027051_24950 [Niabella terrae]
MNRYQNVHEALTQLRLRGYCANFSTDNVCLYCGDLDLRLDPQEFIIDETYRFPPAADGKSYLLLAISSITGLKGYVLDDYGGAACQVDKRNLQAGQSS